MRLRSVRLSAAKRRHARGRVFRRRVGRASFKLFLSGTKPVAGFGAEVTGLPEPGLNSLRTMAVSHVCGSARKSRTAALLLHGDPTVDLACAASRRWARECWRSDLSTLAMSRSQLADAYYKLIKAPSVSGWKGIRGPLSAATLELGRFGWTWPHPTHFRDHAGRLWDLCGTSPARLLELFKESHAYRLGLQLGDRPEAVGLGCGTAVGLPVDPPPIQKL